MNKSLVAKPSLLALTKYKNLRRFFLRSDGMSTVCCLTIPSSHYSLISPSLLQSNLTDKKYRENNRVRIAEEEEEENYSIILNQPLASMTYPNNLPISNCYLQQQQQQPLLLVAEEAEVLGMESQNDNDRLLLPCSTRSIKRRTSLFEKSRDWARRLLNFHRIRRSEIANSKIHETCCELNKSYSLEKSACGASYYNYSKNFDEDGYLSPMEIQAKLDDISQPKYLPYAKRSKTPSDKHLILYSHSRSDVSQSGYRCHGPIIQTIQPQCTCLQQEQHPPSSLVSDFHKSLSIVDYIDFDVSETSAASKSAEDNDDSDDPLECLKYLFNENQPQQQGNFHRRTPRRSTNTSSISADSGYCDMSIPSTTKLIPVHLVSCRLIPVNVTRTKSMDTHCLTCTCPSSSSSSSKTTTTTKTESANYFSNEPERRRRKFSTYSSQSNSHRTCSRQHMNMMENEINNHCTCNKKYYSTMTICPTLSVTSPMGIKPTTKFDINHRHDYYSKPPKGHSRRKRTNLPRFSIASDDLSTVLRWYRPHLEREAVCQALQTADYGAFILRNSTTHPDCYALSVKVPKFTHESNIAHYLIEKIVNNETSTYRIKGTIKQFPTLLSLLTHHSVMPEILPITLNLNETLSI